MSREGRRSPGYRLKLAGFLPGFVLLLCMAVMEIAGMGGIALAQRSRRAQGGDSPTSPMRTVSIQNHSYPPSYGDAVGFDQFFEYINVFSMEVDEENRTLNITVKVVITTGEEEDYGAGEFVNVWIDFDGSGTFDANEQVMDQLQFAQAVGFRGILTYTQEVSIPEDAVVHTWTRACLGYNFDPGPTGFWQWGNSVTRPVTLGGVFTVSNHDPENDAQNLDFENILLEVQFGKPYDPETLNDNTFLLEYRSAGGEYQKVNGTIFTATNTVARFRPSGPLKDGVIYRVTIKGGASGVKDRGDPPAELSGDYQWRFATLVDLTNKVKVHTFQVARDARLVPGKPALVRVYAEWEEKPEVHDDSEVKEFRAKVSLENGSGGAILSPKNNVLIKRPDQFTAAEKKDARNSVNFFNWRPASGAGSSVKAIIEARNQNVSPPKKYEGIRDVTYWDKSPTLEFDYYFLKVGDWKDGVPAAARTSSRQLAAAGGIFTTQNFPALSTTGSGAGDFSTNLPDTVIELIRNGKTRRYYITRGDTVRVDGYVGRKLYDSAVASGSTADMIVGFIPQNFQLGITGVAFNFGGGKRTVLIVQGSANASTVAHEFAHFYQQGHNSSNNIEGFRIATTGVSGWNKSKTEGNQQAGALKSLMTPSIQPVNERFILNGQYVDLFNRISTSHPLMIASLNYPEIYEWLEGEAQSYLVITGTINKPGSAARIDPVKIVNLEEPPLPEAGPFILELQDNAGSLLSSISFDTLHTDPYHGEPLDNQMFNLAVPYESSLAKIVIKNGSTVIGEFERSPNAPVVEITAPGEGQTWSGTQMVQWSGSDSDGDPLSYTLAYSPSGRAPWISILNDYLQTSYEIDTNTLQAGSQPTFRLIASDGLNTSEDTVSFHLSNELSILATSPANGDTVGVTPTIMVFFNTDFDTSTFTTGNFTLQDAALQEVPSQVAYDPATRSATLTPAAPLQPDRDYTATLPAGLTDLYGNALGSNFSWTFHTEVDREAPQPENLFPPRGALNVNPASWVRIEFNEALDPATVNSANVVVQDVQGNSVSGAVAYESENRAIVFKPDAQLSLRTEYQVLVSTGITDAAGNPLEAPLTWSFTTAAVPPGKGALNRFFEDFGLDADGDGIFESLQIRVGITLLEPLDVVLIASLTDSTGNAFVQGEAEGNLSAGDHQLLLTYPGEVINANGVGGVFTLGPVYLYERNNDSWTVLEYQKAAYQTNPYSLEQFKKAGATLLGNYSDEGIDDNANGLFDWLRIHVGLFISEPGDYRVRGQLYDSQGFYIQQSENSEFFSATGEAEIILDFEGGRIRGHGDAAPYQLRFVDVFDDNNRLLDSRTDAYTTAIYTAEDFEISPADLQVFADQLILVQGDSAENIITLRSHLFNFGGTTVDTAVVRVRVDGIPLGDDILLFNLSGVPQEFSLPWDISQQSGSFNVSLTADPDDLVEEIDEFNNIVSVTVNLPITDFPLPPANLSAVYEPGAVELSWQPPPGGWTGFFVYRRIANSPEPFTRITFESVKETSFRDSTVAPDTAYSYVVRTFRSGQPSLESRGSDTLKVDTVTDIEPNGDGSMPDQFMLHPAYPNPFNPETSIRYDLPRFADVKVELFNILGQRVRVLVEEKQPAGRYTVKWNGQKDNGAVASSGIYLVRLIAGDFSQIQKIALIK